MNMRSGTNPGNTNQGIGDHERAPNHDKKPFMKAPGFPLNAQPFSATQDCVLAPNLTNPTFVTHLLTKSYAIVIEIA